MTYDNRPKLSSDQLTSTLPALSPYRSRSAISVFVKPSSRLFSLAPSLTSSQSTGVGVLLNAPSLKNSVPMNRQGTSGAVSSIASPTACRRGRR